MFEFLSDVKKDLKAGLRSLTLRNKTNSGILSKESGGGGETSLFFPLPRSRPFSVLYAALNFRTGTINLWVIDPVYYLNPH